MSKHLKEIVEKNNQLANIQVVFIDIEKYSQRRTSSQVLIINEFTNVLQKSIKEIGQIYIDFIQKNDLNFKSDIIIIPTGDGAAINFTFEGLHDIHIAFAESFLKNENVHNENSPRCDKFDSNGWCNCHSKFNVRIGIDDGKAIIYQDINGNYNVAGNPINMAARLLGESNRNQILLTENAYKQIIDLSENPNYSDDFIEIPDVTVKHGVEIKAYILKSEKEYINSDLSKRRLKQTKLNDFVTKVEDFRSNLNPNMDLGNTIMQFSSILNELSKLDDENSQIENRGEAPTAKEVPLKIKNTRRGK